MTGVYRGPAAQEPLSTYSNALYAASANSKTEIDPDLKARAQNVELSHSHGTSFHPGVAFERYADTTQNGAQQ